MLPKVYLQQLAAAIVKRSGICQATVEAVLPHVFDEIRYQLIEGHYPCVPIDSFGTFSVIEKPSRRYHYYRPEKGIDRWVDLPPKRVLKFAAAYNMRRELQAGVFDDSRKSFSRHPKDPAIRKRKQMKYQPRRRDISKGTMQYMKSESSD